MCDKVKRGEIESLNRPRDKILDTKISKMVWPNTWYLKGSIISTLSCVVTPNSKLKTLLSKAINNDHNKYRVMVIEDGGLPITRGLKIGDPGRKAMDCVFGHNDCIVSPKHNCDQQGVIYRIQCKTCDTVIDEDMSLSKKEAMSKKPSYIGLTRTSVHNRMNVHLLGRRYKKNSSPMWRHDRDTHGGNPQEYSCSVVGHERKIVRLFNREALEIERLTDEQKINDREECGRGGLVRITAHRQVN